MKVTYFCHVCKIKTFSFSSYFFANFDLNEIDEFIIFKNIINNKLNNFNETKEIINNILNNLNDIEKKQLQKVYDTKRININYNGKNYFIPRKIIKIKGMNNNEKK